MPSGVPVATVAINGGKNAGLLAVQILSTSNSELKKALIDYRKAAKLEVIEKNNRLQEGGYKEYLSKMKK